MKNKIFIHTAVWGDSYVDFFLNYNLASLLCQGNILTIAKRTIFLLNTSKDYLNHLKNNYLFKKLEKICEVRIELTENLVKNSKLLPNNEDVRKYSLLSLFQSLAMRNLKINETVIFNYPDLIYSNNCFKNLKEIENKYNIYYYYLLHCDKFGIIEEINKYKSIYYPKNFDYNVDKLKKIVFNNLHREQKLRFWDDEKFTNLPSTILWKVGNEGILIRCYHYSILFLKKTEQNQFLVNKGIEVGTLDTLVLQDKKIKVNKNYDKTIIFSCSDLNRSQSALGGPSRQNWYNYTRYHSYQDFLNTHAFEEIRKLALIPIQFRIKKKNKKLWSKIIKSTEKFVKDYHYFIKFDEAKFIQLFEKSPKVENILASLNAPKALAPELAPAIAPESAPANRINYFIKIINYFIKFFRTLKVYIYKNLTNFADSDNSLIFYSKLNILIFCYNIILLKYSKEKINLQNESQIIGLISSKLNLGICYWFNSQFNVAFKFFAEVEEVQNQYCYNNKINEIFLMRSTYTKFGTIGHLDAIIKYYLIKKENITINLIYDKKISSNHCLMSLYGKFINLIPLEKATIKEKTKELILSRNFHWVMPELDFSSKKIRANKLRFSHYTFSQVFNYWKESQKPPLLEKELKKEKLIINKINLQNLKYVCLSIRKNDYKIDEYRSQINYDDFIDSINYLHQNNYYVVLLGENKINKDLIINQNMLIEYNTSCDRNEKNDLLILYNCILFIGSASGPQIIAKTLNKSICLINTPVFEGFPYMNDCLYLPLIVKKKNNILPLIEFLKDYKFLTSSYNYKKFGLSIEKNSSEDILDCIKESLFQNKLINNYEKYNIQITENYRNKIKDFNKNENTYISPNIASCYINKISRIK
jgi:putative glycosyltransferase (TIGR04372 family)